MTNQQSTFKNDSIAVTVSREPGCKVRLETIVSPLAVEAAYKKGIAIVKKEISVPGFRKGKAPDSMVVTSYAKYIDKEWKDVLTNTALNDAIKLTGENPFNKNISSAELKRISKDDGALLVFEYEAAPAVPSLNPDDFSVPQVDVKPVTDQEVNDLIEKLQLQNASWTDITDRPAQENDYVVVSIDDVSGSSPRHICQEALLHVTDTGMEPWLRKLMIGLNGGESAEAMSEAPKHADDCSGCADGTHADNSDFIPTLCRATVHTVRQATPHALDDELAKKHGASSVEDLTEKAKKALENQALNDQREAQRNFIEKTILEKYRFDMPASLVEGELAGMEAAITQKMKAEHVPQEQINAETKKLKENVRHKYERDFLLYFITQKAAREHNITVGKEEVTMELMKQMFMEQQNKTAQNSFDNIKERQFQIEMQLLATKVLDFLIEKSK